MRIQNMSDLHMEFQENSRYLKNNELPVTGDVLVLAGDIFYLKDKVAPLTKFCRHNKGTDNDSDISSVYLLRYTSALI